jgi:hypothetical protein
MDNNEIDPKIKKMLEGLQEVPDRSLQASHTSREKFLTQVRALKPRPTPRQQTTRTRKIGQGSWIPRFATIAAVIIIVLSTLGGTVYAAQASGPEDLLYGVKTLTEDIQASLETDPQDKLDLYVHFASRRLQEIRTQIEAGEEVSEKALVLLEQHNQNMVEQAAQLGEEGLTNALRQIELNLQQQNQLMAELGKEHPQGEPPGLLKSKERIQERLELIENGKEEPKEFKNKVKEFNQGTEDPGQGNQEDKGNSNKPETPPGQEEGQEEKNNKPGNGSGGK